MTAVRFLVASAAFIALASCSDSNGPTSGCPKQVDITVSSGTVPEFSWTPACPAVFVTVNQTGGSAVWAIGFASTNPAKTNAITPPVTYGDTLAIGDSLVANPPAELTAGQAYTVYVWSLTNVGTAINIGQKAFTP